MGSPRLRMLCLILAVNLLFGWAEVFAQPKTIEMHHPKGWQFTMPKGDAGPRAGRFSKSSAASCAMRVARREISRRRAGSALGPELSQMGPLHPLEYFTESVINPSAHAAKKYRGPGR